MTGRLTSGVLAALFVLFSSLAPPCRAETLPHREQVEKAVNPALADDSRSISVVYAEGKFSHIEYSLKSAPPSSTEPDLPEHFLESPDARTFGTCRREGGRFTRAGKGHCGIVISLSSPGPFNLAAMDRIEITGSFSGNWRVALADLPRHLQDENIATPVQITVPGTSVVELAPLTGKLDLTRVMSVILLLESSTGEAAVSRIGFARAAAQAPSPGKGIWLWDTRRVLGREDDVAAKLQEGGFSAVYAQVDDYPEKLLPFLTSAAARGISVFALDGDPGHVASPELLVRRVNAAAELSRRNPETPFAGFQVDIEPYLNKDFQLRRDYYSSAYLALLKRLKQESGMHLSVVVPFWFDTLHAAGSTLLQRTMEIADELVVMSYRTDPSELRAITRTELGLGEKLSRKVSLGIELTRIPDERHIGLTPAQGPSDVKLRGRWWKKKSDHVVKGGRISFRDRMAELPAFMAAGIPFRSFGGWVLHSYEEWSGGAR